jgi:beta-glucosidase/6-phospho-beta-glucosidase/beta-galactosidase
MLFTHDDVDTNIDMLCVQDNLEWASGFQMHFGLIWIDRPSMERVVKDSLRWYSSVLNKFYNTVKSVTAGK